MLSRLQPIVELHGKIDKYLENFIHGSPYKAYKELLYNLIVTFNLFLYREFGKYLKIS